ncbi:hypothetical protein [Lacrimispora indolis]|uniref:hypothetical protein n=1 Tax=Lacrimispora indolis TaxID=69825 RepID=UPI00040EC4F9|nr:hypothetical protein [[Clostridium] methoxybenzovorans]
MKVKIKGSILSLLLSLFLSLSVPFSSLADLATNSQATYATEYIGIAPMSSISIIQNTVDYSDVAIELAYYDMSNVIKYAYANVSSDGSFNMSRPSDMVSVIRFGVVVNKRSLPSSGTFSFVVDFAMHTPMTYGSSFVYLTRVNTNATSESTLSYDLGLVQNYGDFQVSGVLRLGLVNSVAIMATVVSSVPTTISGVVKIKFTRSSSTPDVISPGADSVEQDIQSNISNNTGTLVEQQEETNGLLVEIIQTISNQLKAFWDQLAGEFTNLYNKMNQQHQEKLEADRNNTEDIIDNNNSNTDKITENQDKNTDQALNGYDSSALDNSSNDLNDTLTEYSDLENSITESMGSHLEEFEYNDISGYPSGVLASLLFFGNYTQDIFETIGNFNLSITLGLTLTFVLMLIGYFRYGR